MNEMTPTTAAALRALAPKIDAIADELCRDNQSVGARTLRQLRDCANAVRIAVLTQEGAGKVETGIPLSHSCVFGQLVGEPRAAEGAGTVACPECSAALLYECVACSANNYPPTAAAAVPAGGDAFDGFFYGALDPRPKPATVDGKVLPLVTVVLYQACGGDADKFWLATLAMRKAFEAGQAASSPRGGVTDACAIELAEQLERWVNGDSTRGVLMHANMRRWAKHLRSTPPAAQAQDAGPMATAEDYEKAIDDMATRIAAEKTLGYGATRLALSVIKVRVAEAATARFVAAKEPRQ